MALLVMMSALLCALLLAWGISRRAPLLAAQIISEPTGDSDIYLLDPNFPKVVNLTRDPDWLEVAPAWKPDNRLGFIAIDPHTATNELHVYDLAAHHTEARRLPLLTIDSPVLWSPRGRLALVGSTETNLRTLYIAESPDAVLLDITPWSDDSDSYPVWLSDEEIAFVSDVANATSQVILLNVDTGIWQTISDSRMINVALVASPEEGAIVFHGYNPARVYSDEWNTYLWRETLGRITMATDETFAGSMATSIWDGKVLLVKTVNGETDVYVYEIETRSLRNLTHDAYYETDAAWSPDGQIAYIANRDGAYGIYLLNPTTGEIAALLRIPNTRIPTLAWSR
jgi:hypothetical protein